MSNRELEVLGQDRENENPLSQIGLTLESVLSNSRDSTPKPHLICICGHALNKHGTLGPGRNYCRTAQMWCPCGEVEAVLEVQDSRYFMRATYGYGAKHALIAGLARLIEVGKNARWVVPLRCQNCGSFEGPVLPVAIDSRGELSDKPEKLNLLSCMNCILKSQGIPTGEG